VLAIVLAASGTFDKDTAPPRPNSEAAKMAFSLKESGDINRYRSVDPDKGWDAEYELDGSDGVVRSRLKDGKEEIEFEAAFDDDLRHAIEKSARRRGYDITEK
jgi:hypothetical protein